ncbi:DeoR/GlpR family DNA-binding transcription regulator [Desmospora profundinema]|uniref:DeoR/GlpR family transcriptional regulator of sugar metabolism n=1 Tax=Desmospora profundinema TaxID=1571184 RepID=A0ABU1IKA9_9BACL|nr:DeoR/GlpR family DNA-binding transcription regulator [Desmospora profundinema]MDR6225126.1 DeoR/GlpR family transcriptional regulator of sugar metabolism [Desmospora profundinema]
MYQEERLRKIREYLEQYKRISVQEICDRFGVSRDTARRDLVKLDEQGVILRTRGGALLPEKEVKSYRERLESAAGEKEAIGREAAGLIRDGEHLILDASTTVQAVAASLTAEDVTVVTNSIDIASVLADRPHVSVRLLGGKLHPKHRYVYGATTVAMLRNYRVDKAFLGASGITPEGVFYPDEEDGQVIRESLQCAGQVIVLADATKFHRRFFYRVCDLGSIDRLVTDQPPPADLQRALEEQEVEIMEVTPHG